MKRKTLILTTVVLALLLVTGQSLWAQNGNTWTIQYFNNPNWTPPYALGAYSAYIDFNWGTVPPGPGMPSTNWTATMTSSVYFPYSGAYVFQALADDEIALQIDGVTYINTIGAGMSGLCAAIKLEQLGNVILEDDVEIGANTTIDRARFKTTHIGAGTKIDNLVQIGHNVTLGDDNIVVSQTGISGSVKTGHHVIFGGQAGVVGHIEITDQVMVATRGGVSKSITRSGKYAGSPVTSLSEYNRQQVHLRKITEYVEQIESLEKRLKELEARCSVPVES